MEVVILSVKTMIQTTFCPMMTIVAVSQQAYVCDHILLMKRRDHRCPEKPSSTIDISTAKMTKLAE
jgi:hypothetical protein